MPTSRAGTAALIRFSCCKIASPQCNRADTRTKRMLLHSRRRVMQFFNISDDLLFGAALAFVIAVVLALV